MLKRDFISCLLFGIFMTTRAFALEAYPIPKSGFCPSGYHASGNYCVPSGPQSGAAIVKDGFCPTGYHANGDYCLANGPSAEKAIPRSGFCPSGYHSSGNYCLEN